jgi:hypothetical protein
MDEDVLGSYRRANKIFVGHNEGSRPLGRPRSRWEDNTEIDLTEACGLYTYSLGSR